MNHIDDRQLATFKGQDSAAIAERPCRASQSYATSSNQDAGHYHYNAMVAFTAANIGIVSSRLTRVGRYQGTIAAPSSAAIRKTTMAPKALCTTKRIAATTIMCSAVIPQAILMPGGSQCRLAEESDQQGEKAVQPIGPGGDVII